MTGSHLQWTAVAWRLRPLRRSAVGVPVEQQAFQSWNALACLCNSGSWKIVPIMIKYLLCSFSEISRSRKWVKMCKIFYNLLVQLSRYGPTLKYYQGFLIRTDNHRFFLAWRFGHLMKTTICPPKLNFFSKALGRTSVYRWEFRSNVSLVGYAFLIKNPIERTRFRDILWKGPIVLGCL